MAKRKTTKTSTSKTSKAKATVLQRSDTPILSIAASTDESQLLMTLRRVPDGGGASQWLSPIGWVDSRKSTLLDCYASDEGCEIIIPDSYAQSLATGDELHVTCSTLNLKDKINWQASAAHTNVDETDLNLNKVKRSQTSAATGFMARLLPKKSDVSPQRDALAVKLSEPSEAEKRAKDAQRLADDYRKQMEEAATAREAAQQRALDAAKKAEDALQAETARIAEMERVAKAYAEAEAKRQDEERRLDAERRAEQLRHEEEARLAEEARQKELAKIRAAERSEEKRRLLTVQEEASNQRASLVEKIESERSSLHRLISDRQAKVEHLTDLTKQLPSLETDLSLLAQKLNEKKGSVSALNERLEIANARLSEVTSLSDSHVKKIEEAEINYHQAQAEVEAALSKAEAMKSEHLHCVEQANEVQARLTQTKRVLQAIEAEDVAIHQAVLEAQTAYDSVQQTADQTRDTMAALDANDTTLAKEASGCEAEIDRLSRELNTALSQQEAAEAALSLLEEGGDPKAARKIMATFENERKRVQIDSAHKNAPAIEEQPAAEIPTLKSLLRPKRAVALKAPAPAERVAKESIQHNPKPSNAPSSIVAAQIAANENTGLSFNKKAVGLGAAAIALGFGWSFVTGPDGQKTVEVKEAPSVVLTAKTPKITPSSSVTPTFESHVEEETKPVKVAATETIASPERAKVKSASTPKFEIAKPKHKSINVAALSKKVAKTVKADMRAAEIDASNTQGEKAKRKSVKSAAVKVPTQQAIAKSAAPKIKAIPRKQSATNTLKPQSKQAELKPVTISPVPVSQPTPVRSVMSPAVTRTVQGDLKVLGYYNGPIHGAMSDGLQEAAELFNTIYDRPKGDVFTASFVSSLQKQASELRAIPVKVASANTPAIPIPNGLNARKVNPIETAPESIDIAPAAVDLAEARPIPPVDIPETIQDTIVEAVTVKPMRVRYPSRAARNDVYENVDIEITYDILSNGRVSNARVTGNNFTGRHATAFEAAALGGVNAMRFTPKTVNGEPVESFGISKLVKFRVE